MIIDVENDKPKAENKHNKDLTRKNMGYMINGWQ